MAVNKIKQNKRLQAAQDFAYLLFYWIFQILQIVLVWKGNERKTHFHSNAKDFSNLNWAVVETGRGAAEHPNCWNKAFLGEKEIVYLLVDSAFINFESWLILGGEKERHLWLWLLFAAAFALILLLDKFGSRHCW